MANGHQKFISRPEVSFWLPILATVVSITIWGMTLSSQINVISTKIEAFEKRIANLEETDDKHINSINRWVARVITLEGKHE